MRRLLGFAFVLVLLAAGAMFAAYREIEPCRALAVEQARRAESASGLPVAGLVEPISRMQTSQLSTLECSRDLVRSWSERLSHEIH
jgi:hypothetical protein